MRPSWATRLALDPRAVLAVLAGLAYCDLSLTHILQPEEWRAGIAYAVIAASHFLAHRRS